MAREIVIVRVGRSGRAPWEGIASDYRKRISRFVKVREVTLKPSGARDEASRLREEAQRLQAAVPAQSHVVALERSGRTATSEKFSKSVDRWQGEGRGALVFLIGSDLGLDSEILEFSDESMSLGALTLPHDLARVVLHEQIYRAFTILRGINYHRQPKI